MRETIASFEQFYTLVSTLIRETEERLAILDLGCGTGLELRGIFDRAPNAVITGVDVSEKMLSELKRKYTGHPETSLIRKDKELIKRWRGIH